MADISPIGRGSVGPLHHNGHLNGSAKHNQPNPPNPSVNGSANGIAAHRDRVELSEHARFMDSLRQLPAIRTDLVEAVREAISNGTYETPEKLDIAVSHLLDDLL